MEDQIINFLLKYQEMRKAKVDYDKGFNKMDLNKSMKLALELDDLAPKILAALTQTNP